ncbi:ATP-binding protein (plasmid) [Pseudomonas sp. BYT-5]|uniref:ATP-binding protein n=1 Tax=unclassified Pseudomonas TaxID=196821 RepID=UPI0020223796|nr:MULTISPECIES: ATP-binding protein [unclassified Pseudomonas]URD45483.1 ATP-binding protein [Pseudomonas sp. BYT-5]URL00691.1 ATP-binding protein [Pseudomonas sp. BYT-1]
MPAIDLDDAIVLPAGLGTSTPHALFTLCSQIANSGNDIVLDASNLNYVDPLGMATLRALFEQQIETKRISIQFLSKNLTSYLARMDFFKGLDIEGVDLNQFARRNDRANSLVEITKVSEHAQAEAVASRLANAITGKLTRSDPDAPVDEQTGRNEFDSYRGPLEYALKELLENSLTHARREGRIDAAVWVTCQFYPKLNLVRMAIVDNGCGFLATLRNHPELAERTDRGAIEAALKPRVSCNRGAMANILGSENQGVGLTTTAKIAETAGGGLIVVSGRAIHDTQRNRFDEMHETGWQGVSIGFTCQRESLPGISISALLPSEEDENSDAQDHQDLELDLDFR